MSPVSLKQCSLRDMRACFSVRPAKTNSWQHNAHTGNAHKRHRPEASPQDDVSSFLQGLEKATSMIFIKLELSALYDR